MIGRCFHHHLLIDHRENAPIFTIVTGSLWYDFTGSLAASCIQFQVCTTYLIKSTLHFTLLAEKGKYIWGERSSANQLQYSYILNQL